MSFMNPTDRAAAVKAKQEERTAKYADYQPTIKHDPYKQPRQGSLWSPVGKKK